MQPGVPSSRYSLCGYGVAPLLGGGAYDKALSLATSQSYEKLFEDAPEQEQYNCVNLVISGTDHASINVGGQLIIGPISACVMCSQGWKGKMAKNLEYRHAWKHCQHEINGLTLAKQCDAIHYIVREQYGYDGDAVREDVDDNGVSSSRLSRALGVALNTAIDWRKTAAPEPKVTQKTLNEIYARIMRRLSVIGDVEQGIIGGWETWERLSQAASPLDIPENKQGSVVAKNRMKSLRKLTAIVNLEALGDTESEMNTDRDDDD
ncbi:hypothetical protein JCM10207_007333 [Rhodosporidiobolus poonsookiae]